MRQNAFNNCPPQFVGCFRKTNKLSGKSSMDDEMEETVGVRKGYRDNVNWPDRHHRAPLKAPYGTYSWDDMEDDMEDDESVGFWRGAAIKYGPGAVNAVNTWGPAVKHCISSMCRL